MTRYFWLREAEPYTASIDAAHRWGLPGVKCHACGATWGGAGHQYPGVDLSQLPESARFESHWPVSVAELEQLRELVRPLLSPNATLPPGTDFGPLTGRATGKFRPFTSQGNILWVVRRDALEHLQAEGVRGLVGFPTALRFRQKDSPELLELQIEPYGRLHPDCLPPDLPPPCVTCGRLGLTRPEEPVLDVASLPTDLDLFRVGNFATMVIGTERFRDAVRRLELDGITFRELPSR
ncbi:MAG TPA: double-CXXCG motif protein [Myxococcus sp.]|nr:double-CXXCG motif protein [Myxococcus sp.]